MTIQRPPFTPTRLEEERERDTGKVLAIRLNAHELKLLEEMKTTFDTPSDSTAIKICWFVGWNVIQRDVGVDYLKWLSRRDRVRLEVPKD